MKFYTRPQDLDRAETNIKYLGYALDYTSIKYSRVAYS